jgi:hypothetical protein
MKEYDKQKSHISSKIHVIYTSSNNVRHPVAKTFTTLHYSSPNYTALYFTTIVDKRTRTTGFLIHVETFYLPDNLHQIIVNQRHR